MYILFFKIKTRKNLLQQQQLRKMARKLDKDSKSEAEEVDGKGGGPLPVTGVTEDAGGSMAPCHQVALARLLFTP